MDDLAQLQSRVEAARDRLGDAEADQRKYGLRLDDLVRIVEGALSRQSAELKAAKIRSASLQTELDDAQTALSRTQVDLEARETDVVRLQAQNEQLRAMVLTLLELVEGRSATPLREAMIRLERGVRNLITDAAIKVPQAADPRTPAPAAKSPPDIREVQRPVLVPNQTIQGQVPQMKTASPIPEPAPESSGEALLELTSVGRGNSEQIVKEPPAGSGASTGSVAPIRRVAEGGTSSTSADS